MKWISSNSRGFTLIEVLASITLFSVVMGVGILLFSNLNAQVNRAVNNNKDRSTLTQLVQNMTEELSEATEVYIIDNNNEIRYMKNSINSIGAFVYRNNQIISYCLNCPSSTVTATLSDFQNPNFTFNSSPEYYTLKKTYVSGMTIQPHFELINANKSIFISLRLPGHNPNGINGAPLINNDSKYFAEFEVSLFTDSFD